MHSNDSREMEASDLDRLFEEYVDSHLLQPFGDSTSIGSSLDGLSDHEIASSNGTDLSEAQPRLDRETKAAWHKALQDCDQSLTSSWSDYSASPSYAASSTGKESYSDSELSKFQEVIDSEWELSQSLSQPSTPQPHISNLPLRKAISFQHQRQHSVGKAASRKSSPNPRTKMMRFGSRSYTPGTRRRHTATPINFPIGTSADQMAAYALPTRLVKQEKNDKTLVEPCEQSHSLGHLSLPMNDANRFADYQSTSSFAAIGSFNDECYHDNTDVGFGSCSLSSAALSALLTPPSSLPSATKTWIPDTASVSSLDLTTLPEFYDSPDACEWWSSEVTTTQLCYHAMENSLQFTSQKIELHGPGIAGKSTPFDADTPIAQPIPTSASASCSMPTYSAMCTAQPQEVPASTGNPCSRTPSPTFQPPSHRRKPSSRSRPRHRASHLHRRRSSSSSQHSSSRQASNTGTGNVYFVNFTPEDSKKLLTGVAPSGSSKTKARREREAADRRRKLTQAAVKTAMEASGYINCTRLLERDGLLVV